MYTIKKDLDNLYVVITTVTINEMEAYKALKNFALDHNRLAISQMIFDEYWDEGLAVLEKLEAQAVELIDNTLNKFRAEIHRRFKKEVKASLVDAFRVSNVDDFLLTSMIDTEADELGYDFGCLGYDEEYLNKVLSEYEDIDDALEIDTNPFILSEDDIDDTLMTDLEIDTNFKFDVDLFDSIYKEVKQQRENRDAKIKEMIDPIVDEQHEIQKFVRDATKEGYEKFKFKTKNIVFDEEYIVRGNKKIDMNRLNKLFNSILVVTEKVDSVALLLKLNKDESYRQLVIRKADSYVKNSLSGGTFKQKIKTSGSSVRHQMDIQLEKKQGFEVGMLAAMAYEILDGVGRDTYKNTFVSHKFDQGNRDTSPVHNNCSRKGVEILINDGINKYINDVHKFINDDKNLYIIEGKDVGILNQILTLKEHDPQLALQYVQQVRKDTGITNSGYKMWEF